MSTSKSTQSDIDNVVLDSVLSVLTNNNGVWSGTMTALRVALTRVLGKKNAAVLPGSPGALRVVVNRVVNRLRARGVSVKFARTPDHVRTRYVRFSR